MSPRLTFAIDVAIQGGLSTLAHFQAGREIELKSDDSPVTVADREAERAMRAAIARAYPGEAILGEEEGSSGEGDSRWVLDPIDGTKSFVSGVPLYATLVAWESEREPVIGVCFLPALGELIYAERGSGALWVPFGRLPEKPSAEAVAKIAEPAKVGEAAEIAGAIVSSGSMTSMARADRLKGFQILEGKAMAARTWSDAYGHALVATGRIAAMIDPIVARWDVSAMAVIVREAGGRFTDFRGLDELAEEAISSNGLVHEEVLEAFRR